MRPILFVCIAGCGNRLRLHLLVSLATVWPGLSGTCDSLYHLWELFAKQEVPTLIPLQNFHIIAASQIIQNAIRWSSVRQIPCIFLQLLVRDHRIGRRGDGSHHPVVLPPLFELSR